ncbi:hypothetical protein AZ54_22795 [Xanthomonas oryzae pv. oryzae PXO86]|uniref:Uncharacterized protein n=1 Tax=Xanthomonas oryzae pv. oryzae (strain PXO99A) TaxID=360094 RepID=A0A0K0GQU2_XANOP|nr:hypothetical protein PXO_02877 [Xanthomonas oryzae pv. oryzae PXO99A]AJQ85676.1 hypothetical protein AZ54_22795 [Xanthomonas oryzae pv. oryzae PXO86]
MVAMVHNRKPPARRDVRSLSQEVSGISLEQIAGTWPA